MNGFLWVEIFFGFMLAMVISVPRRSIVRLIPVGLFGGFGQALLLLSFLVPAFGVWKFSFADIFSIAGIPVFIAMAWVPVVIIYSYFLPPWQESQWFYTYTVIFSLATALFVYWLNRAGFLHFARWNSLYTIPVAFILYLLNVFYLRYAMVESESHAPED